MKDVYDACQAAGVEIPGEVMKFFQGTHPDEHGVLVPIEGTDAVTEYHEYESDGFDVDIRKLPPGLYIIRFYNSW